MAIGLVNMEMSQKLSAFSAFPENLKDCRFL